MSLRTTTRGLLFASTLVLGFAAVGCGDSDKTPSGDKDDMDAGAGDASTKADATIKDAAPDTSTGGPVTCGTLTCTPETLVGVAIGACCTEKNTCGIVADDLKKLNAQSKFTGCLEKDVPQASPSTHCGEFLDQVEPDIAGAGAGIGHSNKGLDIPGDALTLTFGGCCLANGECGAYLREPSAVNGIPADGGTMVDLHMGCIGVSTLAASLAPAADSGVVPRPAATLVPFCNPTAGTLAAGAAACPAKMGPLLCDQFKAVLPTCDPASDTPDWVCQAINLPKTSDGKVPAVTACLAGVSELVRGCGVGMKKDGCLPNIATTVFGCENFTATAVPVAPKIACGCGDGQIGDGRCIPQVPATVCGTLEPTAKDLESIPKSLCGCGAGALAAGRPCLNNVPKETCGTLDVAPSALTFLPKSLCGCGETTTYNAATDKPCLSKTAQTSCGGGDIPKGTVANPAADCYTGVPAFMAGCGTASVGDGTCLPHGETTVYGCDQPSAAVLSQVKPYLCGCGDSVKRPGQPCLSNVARTTCGTFPMTPTEIAAEVTAIFPDSSCGCDADTGDSTVVTWDPLTSPLPCVSTQGTSVCGNRVVCQTTGCAGATCCPTGQACVDINSSGDGDFCQSI